MSDEGKEWHGPDDPPDSLDQVDAFTVEIKFCPRCKKPHTDQLFTRLPKLYTDKEGKTFNFGGRCETTGEWLNVNVTEHEGEPDFKPPELPWWKKLRL